MSIIDRLPEVRGTYRQDSDLSKMTWFQVGGKVEVLYKPIDIRDLSHFLKNKPDDINVNVMGVGSNILIRDGGLDGVIIRVGRSFANIDVDGDKIIAGAGCLDVNVANFACENSISGMEFLVGVPGTIGGALAMNAGAYGTETKDILVEAEAVDPEGNIHKISNKDMGFSYRSNEIPKDWIFTKAVLQGSKGDPGKILQNIEEISSQRELTQPIKTRTGGSTFKNPEGEKAWQLIDGAGCRGLKIGGAMVSEKHCNFFINTGDATASDIENLGEEVRTRVKEKYGIDLVWEIKILGNKNV